MKHFFPNAFLAAFTLFGTGCAGSYTPIRPDKIATYQSSGTANPVQFAYEFDAFRLRSGNSKYAKKEHKYGYHVVAVRVINTLEHDINFSRDLTLYYGDHPVVPVAGSIASQDMKQGVAIYLLYLLLNFQLGGTKDVRTGQVSGGTFVPTGPFIAGGNMIGASAANGNMRRELETFDLSNRTIKAGETVYGLLSLRESGVAPLRLELSEKPISAPVPAPPLMPASPTPEQH